MSVSMPRPELAPAAIYVDADGTIWTPDEHPEDAGVLLTYPLTMYLPAMVQQSAVHAFPRPPEDEPGVRS